VVGQASDLSEGTTYHFRAVATNALGTTYGADEEFTTLGPEGSPEYGQCVAQKKAAYEESDCKEKAAKAHHGEYEWKPGPAPKCIAHKKGEYTEAACKTKAKKPHKGKFEVASGPGFTSVTGPMTLEMVQDGAIVTCTGGSGVGEVTGVKTGVERFTLTGCESEGKKCTSEGANATPSGTAGVIDTNLLDIRLLGPVGRTEVWSDFSSSEHEPYAMEFGCEGVLFRTKGSVGALQDDDIERMSSSSRTLFVPLEVPIAQGEQALYSELSESRGTSWEVDAPSAELGEVNNTSASSIEIRR
jgi:hypothetical protein